MANTWLNSDGLYVKWGQDAATAGRGGMYRKDGPVECLDFLITLTDLTLTGETILSDVVFLPKNAMIQQIDVIVITASTGANANLDLGVVDADRSSNADDDYLLDASDDWHAAAVGTKTVFNVGSTEAGVGIGATVSNNSARMITAGADTALFTAGVVNVRIYYKMYPTVA